MEFGLYACSLVHDLYYFAPWLLQWLYARCNSSVVLRYYSVYKTVPRSLLPVYSQRSTSTFTITTCTPPTTLATHWEQDTGYYKLCSFAYRVDYIAPTYLSELCVPCTNSRLRSTARGNYVIPRTQTHLANHAFAFAASSSWNCLPDNVRSCQKCYIHFLSKLKTYFLTLYFMTTSCFT